jgi:hypothetical protein
MFVVLGPYESLGVQKELTMWLEQDFSFPFSLSISVSTVLICVRYCRIKTTPHVERKGLLVQTAGPSLLGSEWGGLAKLGSGLYRRVRAMGEGERVSGLWLSAITRWNRSTCLASWVTGSSWVVLQAEKQSGREKQAVINRGLVLRCSLGSFHPPQECQGPNNLYGQSKRGDRSWTWSRRSESNLHNGWDKFRENF